MKNKLNRFSFKIIGISIILLAVSQILGTFISVMKYEGILLDTITTKYKIAGRDLRGRIERSIKFGKRLDGFVGLESMATSLFDHSPDIVSVIIADKDGNIFQSIQNPKQIKKHDMALLLPRETLDPELQRIMVKLQSGLYYVIFPLNAPQPSEEGLLAITFDQSVLNIPKADLVKTSWSKLLISLTITTILMALALHVFVTRPLRRLMETIENEKLQNPDEVMQ